MDYNNLKDSDFVYLSYNVGPAGEGSQASLHTIVTFKNSIDRYYIYEPARKKKQLTKTFSTPPLILIFLYLFFILSIFVPPYFLGNSSLVLALTVIITLPSMHMLGALARKHLGPKKIDISLCEKISIENIKDTHMKGIQKSVLFTFLYWLFLASLISPIAYLLSIESLNGFTIHIIYPINCYVGMAIFYFRYSNMYDRIFSILKIEKEYNEKYNDPSIYKKTDPISLNNLRKSDFVYLPIIDKPVHFLLGYPDVSTIVTFKHNNERFLIIEKDNALKKPKTLTFYRRTIGFFAWALYFWVFLNMPTVFKANDLALIIITAIPLVVALYCFSSLYDSDSGKKKIDVTILEKISLSEIKEKYLKKIKKNIMSDFLYSFVWIAYLALSILNVSLSNVIYGIFLYWGYLLVILMLILRFINIYRRVVAVRKIEKEYKEL